MSFLQLTDYTGELITCDEGELKWVKKSEVPQLPTWEGDAQFLKLLLEDEKRFFADEAKI